MIFLDFIIIISLGKTLLMKRLCFLSWFELYYQVFLFFKAISFPCHELVSINFLKAAGGLPSATIYRQ